MKIGFTGSREGLTAVQYYRLYEELKKLRTSFSYCEGGHGDCVGADFIFHRFARELFELVEIFPPTNPQLRAFCQGDLIHPEKHYLERNKDIVRWCDVLVACPGPTSRGTWYTIKFAVGQGREVTLIKPF